MTIPKPVTDMKVVILAGGRGTRIAEESRFKPKPLVEIGGRPILWHIMKIYSHYGFNDFIICGGYKQEAIKQYFFNYFVDNSDITFDLQDNGMEVRRSGCEPWKVTVVDTGLDTMTGGRIKRIRDYIGDNPFMVTYGDGVSDLSIPKLIDHHKKKGRMATLTAIMPGGRFGKLEIKDDDTITSFVEKKREDGGWVNGGFMVMEPEIFDRIEGDDTALEDTLKILAENGQLAAYRHDGFWQCMDNIRDHEYLDKLASDKVNKAPWIKW